MLEGKESFDISLLLLFPNSQIFSVYSVMDYYISL